MSSRYSLPGTRVTSSQADTFSSGDQLARHLTQLLNFSNQIINQAIDSGRELAESKQDDELGELETVIKEVGFHRAQLRKLQSVYQESAQKNTSVKIRRELSHNFMFCVE